MVFSWLATCETMGRKELAGMLMICELLYYALSSDYSVSVMSFFSFFNGICSTDTGVFADISAVLKSFYFNSIIKVIK